MENLLPLLLGLIFFGLKYYNKTKKKNLESAPPIPIPQTENPNVINPTLDGFMEQLYGGIKSQFEEPVMPPIEAQNAWVEEEIEEEPKSIEYNDRKIVRNKPNTQFETIQNKGSKSTERLDFDLRKAVVYNAIMNPPYL